MDKKSNKRPILIVGTPRSGTTWTANILAQSPETIYIHEPDNERTSFLGYLCKLKCHRMPYLNENHSNPEYYNLFDQAFNKVFPSANNLINRIAFKFSGLNIPKVEKQIKSKINDITNLGEVNQQFFFKHSYRIFKNLLYPDFTIFKNKRRIIKSVHSGLALQFLKKHFDFQLVIMFRHPANVIASYVRMKSPDGSRELYHQPDLKNDYLHPFVNHIKDINNPLALMGLQMAIFYYYWENTVLKDNDTLVLEHEDLCVQSEEKFKKIFDSLNLEWNDKVSSYIEKHNKEGEGYKINRVAKNELDKWKKKFTSTQIKEIQKGYSILPVNHYCEFKSDKL